MGAKQQGRLDGFFKAAPSSPKAAPVNPARAKRLVRDSLLSSYVAEAQVSTVMYRPTKNWLKKKQRKQRKKQQRRSERRKLVRGKRRLRNQKRVAVNRKLKTTRIEGAIDHYSLYHLCIAYALVGL